MFKVLKGVTVLVDCETGELHMDMGDGRCKPLGPKTRKRELLFDITAVSPNNGTTYMYELSAEEIEKAAALLDTSCEFEVEIVYSAYGTYYTSCLNSRYATRTNEKVGIESCDGIMTGYNAFVYSTYEAPAFTTSSAYATLEGFKVYKIV